MYGKLFVTMYDGTLGTRGPWQALVTFQQLIILADQDGVVDMTAEAIARRTTIPLEIITKGLEMLEQPDPDSRSPDEAGRRIVRLSETRSWGWTITNYAKYRRIRTAEDRREYMRKYQRNRRAALTPVNNVNTRKQNQPIAEVKVKAEAIDVPSERLAPSASLSAPPGTGNRQEPEGETVENIPLCDGTDYAVKRSFVDELDRLYPAVDPVQTLREIRGWCLGNERRRKTRRGVRAFLTSWFAREQDKQSRRAS